MLEKQSKSKRGQEIANTLRKKRGAPTLELDLLLAYITDLELEYLRNNAYRIGKSWPGRKSIEGLDLVFILRRALAVCTHLQTMSKEVVEVEPQLVYDITNLSQALIDANVVMIIEEKIDGPEQTPIQFKP